MAEGAFKSMYDNMDMKLKKLKSAGFMFVQFDSYEERVAKGRIQTLYYKRSFEFKSLGQMLLIIDDVLDSVGFEKVPGDPRCFYEEDEEKSMVFQDVSLEDVCEISEISEIYDKNYANAFRGELVIQVLYRKNSSMQGEVRGGARKIYFRSSLELLRIMYEYLEKRFSGE